MFQLPIDQIENAIFEGRWSDIGAIITYIPSMLWEDVFDGTKYKLATLAAHKGRLEQLQLYNRLIRDNSSPELLTQRLLLAFESKSGKPNKDPAVDEDREDTPASEAAANGFVDCLRYLVEECCPSRVLILQEKDYQGVTPLAAALMGGQLETVDYILRTAPRGLAMLDDVTYYGVKGWQIGMGLGFDYNPDLHDYLKNVKVIFLERERERLEEAASYLEEEGYPLHRTMLDIVGQQARVLEYREQLTRNSQN